MADPVCTRDSFISGSSCYRVLDSHERQALRLYLNVLELAAIGGTDYSAELGPGGQLNSDAVAYKTMDNFELELAGLVIADNNATTAGATVPSDIQDVKDAIKCLVNFPAPVLRRMQLLVECELGVHKDYPQ